MDRVPTRNGASRLLDALAGALILAVGMGFGRFSFTGMYPLMVREGQLTVAGGSLAASANYVGYLIGALIMMAATTAAYGVGQIAGPLVSNALLAQAHSFNPPLLVAGGSLLLAALACLWSGSSPRRESAIAIEAVMP